MTYPIGVTIAEQGSGKSKFIRLLQSITDPSTIEETPMFDDPRNAPPACADSHVLVFGNMGRIKREICDILCIIAAKGSLRTRAMRTTGEQDVFQVHNPMLFNSIVNPIPTDRNDLQDRALMLELDSIPVSEKRMESTVESNLNEARARLFGQACLMLQRVLQNHEAVKKQVEGKEDLRLMEASVVMIAGLEGALGLKNALGLPDNKAVLASLRTQRSDNYAAVIGDELGALMRTFVQEKRTGRYGPEMSIFDGGTWSGSYLLLLGELKRLATNGGQERPPKWLPANERYLSEQLARAKGALRHVGLIIDDTKRHSKSRQKIVVISMEPFAQRRSVEREESEAESAYGNQADFTSNDDDSEVSGTGY